MPREFSAGAVVFTKGPGGTRYLLLNSKYKSEYWDFPKGNVENGETPEQAAAREIAEETGITKVTFVPDFKEKINYFYRREGQTIYKEVVFFLAEAITLDVKISSEHAGFEWVTYEEAMKKLGPNTKEVLEKANKILTSQISNWVKKQ